MWARGDGLADVGEGPIGVDLHTKGMICVILEKWGVLVARRGRGWSDRWSLIHRNVSKE